MGSAKLYEECEAEYLVELSGALEILEA